MSTAVAYARARCAGGLDPELHGRFDVVHCHGVLYHEVHSVVLLERLRAMLADGGTLLFGSMMLADPELSELARFVPGAYYNDPSWWWVPGRLAMRWMLKTVGLKVDEEFGLSPGPPRGVRHGQRLLPRPSRSATQA